MATFCERERRKTRWTRVLGVTFAGGLAVLAPRRVAAATPGEPAPAAASPDSAPTAPQDAADAPKPLSETLTGVARAEYEAGRILYGDGDYAGASLKFEIAYRESKDARLLWNMAAAQKNLRKYAEVRRLIGQFLNEAPNLSVADRDQATALLEAVKPFIGSVTLNVNEPKAEVLVDGTDVGTTPLAGPLDLDMGRRHLELRKPEFVTYSADLEVEGGATVAVSAVLVPVKHEGRLLIATDTAGATISIDGRYVGTGRWDGRLPSGTYHIEVTATGKHPSHLEALVQDDQQATFNVTLVADESKVPAWVWIGGSAIAAAGLGVSGYFLFKSDAAGDARPISGTMPPGYVRMP
jgi:PEGA domain